MKNRASVGRPFRRFLPTWADRMAIRPNDVEGAPSAEVL